jgi:hypothetical protein
VRRKGRLATLVGLVMLVLGGTLALAPAASAWTVEMTAEPKLKRTYHWSIEKSVSQPSVTLGPGQSTNVTYSVTVNSTGFTDSDWSAGGNVIISPDPNIVVSWMTVEVLVDNIFALVDCSPHSFPIPLTSGLTCTWNTALPNANSPRTAQMRLQTTDGNFRTKTATFDFANATIAEVDECVDVTDSMAGALGTVCVGDAPKTFTYTKTIGPYSVCGPDIVSNTSMFTTNDTSTTGSAGANVNVTVEGCDRGCSRTIGYWKTHAGFGPQADVVTPLLPITLGTMGGAKSVTVTTAALAVQLLKMMGTNDVHDSENGINKLYAQLLGAKLNAASGADISAVAAVIAAADAFLATHDTLSWSSLSDAQQSQVNSWMSSLDAYNNGQTGPGHCN